ncbi:SelB domain-containing protein [Xenorhabdus nematophila]|uniref:SelB domain-containing protein n=1 Tax=Xenorhabdus nematophila TaxID=628 RepID=UPI000543EACB|nr:SelB C-terminal domain-containing protein [Xenorhabdus nematophila]KHD28321.1 hypothetical protein LH67_11480 [Xenorhabdus nematophila]CEE94185.1 hypothetical protein XNA1_4520019 [Xenorhabdus nematophila str. Anatoliense]CEF30974.1 hypothetical protein XNW1_30019 [Xenorhabdus nematophila str. Websteri]CEF33559.1 hypothetical protein XNW1_4800019 [Xenorhabdus nematophila str. Websteri]
MSQGWQSVPLFVTAAVTGEGIAPLREYLRSIHQSQLTHQHHHSFQNPQPEKLSQRFRLAVDRVFTVKGAGIVVTGTALAGRVSVGDALWLTGSEQTIRVRGLHAQNQPAFLDWLFQLAITRHHAGNLASHLPQGALSLSHFAWARQLTESQLSHLLAEMNVIIAGDWALSLHNAELAEQRLLQVLAEYHAKHPDQLGVGKARLRRMALPTLDETLVYTLINHLLEQKALKQTHGGLHLPEHGLAFTDEQARLWLKAEPYFNTEVWWVRDLATEMGEDEAIIRHLLRTAAQLGMIIAIVPDRYYHRQRIQQFADVIRQYDQDKGGITAVGFRDEFSIGRKLAIQILEFFDRTGFTRRKADLHMLRDEEIF